MSRRIERCLLWGELIVLLMVPANGRCQEVAPRGQARTDAESAPTALERAMSEQETSLIRAIEDLLPRIDDARAHASEMEAITEAAQAEWARQTVDTMRVSAWTVYASDRDAADAVEAFRRVGPEFEWAEGLPPQARRFTVARWSPTRPVIVDGVEGYGISVSAWKGKGALERKTRDALAHAVGNNLPPAMRVWTQNSPVGGSVSDLERSRMFRELRLTPSKATRACAVGDMGGCRSALGLVESPLAQSEAYDPAQLEAMVRYRMHRWAPSECGDAASEGSAACQAWWEDGSNWTQAVPLHGVTRANFLGFVLARSGPTALEDFLRGWEARVGQSSDPAPKVVTEHLVPLLEQVSGQSIDQLVVAFRDQLMDGRTERAATPGTDGLGVIFWVLFAAVLASRSTRWRLG